MTKGGIILTFIMIYIIGIILLVATLYGIRRRTKNKLEKELNELVISKNNIISASILTELNKVKSLINNKYLENLYNSWKKEFNQIKDFKLPHITDKILDIETLIDENKFKEASFGLAQLEMDISIAQNEVNILLDSVKEITMSEERNRNTVTKLKTIYREALTKFNKNKNDYKDVINPIELQFENINKLFGAFENAMEQNEYDNVGKIVKALDETIKNILIVIDEAPTIILMGKIVIPKKISDIRGIYTKLKKSGFNLDYLNLDYNITETEKKLSDIFDRLNVLNLEDSIFDLSNLEGSDFTHSILLRDRFNGSNLSSSNFYQAQMEKVKFYDSIFKGMNAKDTDFQDTEGITMDMMLSSNTDGKTVIPSILNTSFNQIRVKEVSYWNCSEQECKVRLAEVKNYLPEFLDSSLRVLSGVHETAGNRAWALCNIKCVLYADGSRSDYAIGEVADFVKKRSPWPVRTERRALSDTPEIDVQAAIYVIGTRPAGAKSTPVDLSNTDLRGVDFHNLDMSGVDFTGSNLRGAMVGGSIGLPTDLSNTIVRE